MDLCGVFYPDRFAGKKARRASRREVTGGMPAFGYRKPDLREVGAQAAGYVLDLRSAAMVH
jgi:hypothetical protein